MPCDFIAVNCLARELNDALAGGKIEKIFQPSKEELTFSVRSNGKNHLVFASASPSLPVVYIAKHKPTNPEVAPAFCMHLRKHLTHAIIDGISTFNNDRIIKFSLTGRDELNFSVEYALYFELTGRFTNVILTRNGVITEALRHSSIGEAERAVLPGLNYEAPRSNNVPITDLDYVRRTLASQAEGSVSEHLLKSTSGLARLTADYVTKNADFPFSASQTDAVIEAISDLISGKDSAPCVATTGKRTDFFVTEMLPDSTRFDTFCEAVEFCTFGRRNEERRGARMKRIATVVKNALSRNEKKLAINRNKVLDGKNADSEKLKAELITANIYRIKRGDTCLECLDYYTGNDVKIPLDPTLTPQQNAQKLYTRYAKLKRSVEKAEEQIAEINQTIEYLNAVMESAVRAEQDSDFAEIETELMLAGYLSDKRANTGKKDVLSRPIEYRFEGVVVLVGKNNLQNDKLTFKSAINSDLWFHVKGFHGSHVVARIGKEPTPALLHFCAELAAHYSEVSGSTKVDVDYTRIKNVKRHPGGRPGLVTYTDYGTLTVRPSKHEDFIKKI